MTVIAKRLIALILLVVFLIPSTGLMLYANKCNIHNSVIYNTSEKDHCCSQSVFADENHSYNVSFPDKFHANQPVSISALPCCEESGKYLKLGDVLVNQSVNNAYSFLPVFILSNSLFNQYDEIITGNRVLYYQSENPPEIPSYLKYSSLII